MSEKRLIRRVAKAIDAVQIFSRRNDQTMRIEICRHGKKGEPEIVVLKTAPWHRNEADELYKVISVQRALAAIRAAAG